MIRVILHLIYKTRHLSFIALMVALSLLFLFPASVQAHAILLRSDPVAGAALISAPEHVQMWFSEDLNSVVSTAKVLNSANRSIDLNDAHISFNNTREMDVSLQPLLAPGTYIVLWTTQSADDGYVVRGSFPFYVTEPNGTIPKMNGVLPGQNNSSGVSNASLFDGPGFFSFIMATLIDLGVVFWVGAQLWRTFVSQLVVSEKGGEETIQKQAEMRFNRNFAVPLLVLLLLANIGVIVGQALTLTGDNLAEFRLTVLITLATSGRFGMYWLMREGVVLVAILLAVLTLTVKNLSQRVSEVISWLNLILGLALLIVLTMSGHAAAASSDVLVYAVMVDWLHLLAAALWVGGMLYISTIYLPTLKGNTLFERVHSLVSTLSHYSPLVICGVIIMIVSGPFNATIHMSSFAQLITTAYGRALIVKVMLVGTMLITSGLHIILLRPRLTKTYKKYLASVSVEQHEAITVPKSSGADSPAILLESSRSLEQSIERQTNRLTTVLRWEPLLGVMVLVCAGLMNVLGGTLQPASANQTVQPPPTVAVKPFVTTIETGDKLFTLKLTVAPDRFGPNTFTITVLDRQGVKDTKVRVSIYATMLDMDMGTTVLNLKPDGKGNFSADGNLDMGGRWGLRLQVRAPDQKLHEASVKIVATD